MTVVRPWWEPLRDRPVLRWAIYAIAAAILAVQNLKRFKPGLQDGKPVQVSYTVPVSFSIK